MNHNFAQVAQHNLQSKKTLHSGLFFALCFVAFMAFILFSGLFIGSVVIFFIMGVPQYKTEANLAKLFFVIVLSISFTLPLIIYGAIWANHRINMRWQRIIEGYGWSGWTYIPQAKPFLSNIEKRQLRQMRLNLCWQLPCIVLIAFMWSSWIDWFTGGKSTAYMELYFWGGLGGNAVILIMPLVFLLFRAFPNLKREAQHSDAYFWYKWTGNKEKLKKADEFTYGTEIAANQQNQERHNYANLKPSVNQQTKTHNQAIKLKNLRFNLWWQFLLLVPIAVILTFASFDTAVLSWLHLMQNKDVIVISFLSPPTLFFSVITIPALLRKYWVNAQANSTKQSKNLAQNLAHLSSWGAFALFCFCLLLLPPIQANLMPKFDYFACNKINYSRGIWLRAPNPVKWVKDDKAKRGWCVKNEQQMASDLITLDLEQKYGHLPLKYAWLHVYEKGKARFIGQGRQWEITPAHGEQAQNILQYWNIYSWRKQNYDGHYITNVTENQRHQDAKATWWPTYQNISEYWFLPQARDNKHLVKNYYATGKEEIISKKTYAILKSDEEQLRLEYKALPKGGDFAYFDQYLRHNIRQLRIFTLRGDYTYHVLIYNKENQLQHYVSYDAINFTGYGCAAASLVFDENKLKFIYKTYLYPITNCLQAGLQDSEPKAAPLPKAKDVRFIPAEWLD